MMDRKHPCHLFLILIICLFLNNVEANKKLRKIILASLISKTLKNHLGGGQSSIVPIMIPPFKSNDKYQDNGNAAQTNQAQTYSQPPVQQQVQTHVPTITVHHFHHHTTSHHLAEPIYAKYDEDSSYDDHHNFDGSYNSLIEPEMHHNSHLFTNEDHNLGKIKHFHIGTAGNSLLSGSLGGNIGNILSGHIGGQVG